MKKFSFPLDQVLGWRRIELELEQAAMHRALAERNALAAREIAIREERTASERLISGDRYLDPEFISTLPNWQALMKETIVSATNEREASDQKLTQHQTRFFEAKRRVGLLERLREKRLANWKLELGREEEAFAAEAFLARSLELKRRIQAPKEPNLPA